MMWYGCKGTWSIQILQEFEIRLLLYILHKEAMTHPLSFIITFTFLLSQTMMVVLAIIICRDGNIVLHLTFVILIQVHLKDETNSRGFKPTYIASPDYFSFRTPAVFFGSKIYTYFICLIGTQSITVYYIGTSFVWHHFAGQWCCLGNNCSEAYI